MIIWNKGKFYISNLLSKNLNNYIDGVLNKNTSAVFIFDGRSGLGKTTISCQVGCYITLKVAKLLDREPAFNLDNLAFTPEQFIDKLQAAKKGDVIIFDEAMIISNRSAMSEVNRMVIIMMSMIRSKQIFVIFNINSIFDMDKNLPLHRADMLVHLYAENDKFGARGRYMVVPSAKGKLKRLYIQGKKYYDYSKSRPAFVDHFSGWFPLDNKEYENKKQDSIENYFGSQKTSISNAMEQRNRLIEYLRGEGKSTETIANLSGLSLRSVQRVLKSDLDIKYKQQ